MHFQKKMMSLLADPDILNVIDQPLKKSPENLKTHHLKNTSRKFQTKVKDEVMKFNSFGD